MEFRCQNLCKAFPTRNGLVHALEDVTFSAEEREFVSIVGPSGCGKTTLLKLIAGLLRPTRGRIVFRAEPSEGPYFSAMVFQDHGLFPWMTVLENVAFGLEMRGVRKRERRDLSLNFIEKVGLSHFACSYPRELSVGMRQRVGIARAFVADPQMLLMDEPFGSLDRHTKLVLQEELLRVWKDNRKLVVYVTHDIEEAVLLGDRVLVMTGRPGQIREEITVPFERPRNLSDRDRPEIMNLEWHIWKILEEEVRKSLQMTT